MEIMAGRKKTFKCGHIGKGQYCHRCVQEENQKRKAAQAKSEWNDQLSTSPIQLDHLPKKVAKKALFVIMNLKKGKSIQYLRGKRMVTIGQRQVISIPIGIHYRLICCDKNGSLAYIEVITHEEYNNRLSSGGWAI